MVLEAVKCIENSSARVLILDRRHLTTDLGILSSDIRPLDRVGNSSAINAGAENGRSEVSERVPSEERISGPCLMSAPSAPAP